MKTMKQQTLKLFNDIIRRKKHYTDIFILLGKDSVLQTDILLLI